MSDLLDLLPDEIRALGRMVVERIAAYYQSLPERPIITATTSQALRDRLAEPLPVEGCDAEALLRTLDEVVVPFSRHNGHPRFFGYISSPGTPWNAVASMLNAALNINVTCWRSGPAATEMEHVVIHWLK